MNDNTILDLYKERSENAISETKRKYGGYCFLIAMNILGNKQDAEECVSDTLMKAWESIPPLQPLRLKAFLGKITRNISLNKISAKNAKKRGGFSYVSSELEECLPSSSNVEDEFAAREIGKLVDAFLRTITKESRVIFVRRYWYGDSVNAISKRLCISGSKVKSSLFRTRNKLRAFLESEGISV